MARNFNQNNGRGKKEENLPCGKYNAKESLLEGFCFVQAATIYINAFPPE